MNDANDVPKTKAVAIKRTADSDRVTVTAKGTGFLAERILDVAFTKGVKVRSDRDLTNLLEQFDIDSPIPLEALSAVSEILDYVYKANQSMLRKNEEEDVIDTPPAKPPEEDIIDG